MIKCPALPGKSSNIHELLSGQLAPASVDRETKGKLTDFTTIGDYEFANTIKLAIDILIFPRALKFRLPDLAGELSIRWGGMETHPESSSAA
jgi:hypothetical protein